MHFLTAIHSASLSPGRLSAVDKQALDESYRPTVSPAKRQVIQEDSSSVPFLALATLGSATPKRPSQKTPTCGSVEQTASSQDSLTFSATSSPLPRRARSSSSSDQSVEITALSREATLGLDFSQTTDPHQTESRTSRSSDDEKSRSRTPSPFLPF